MSGALVTTTDMANFSNRSKNIATGGQDINSFATDGTIWAFGLSTNSLSPKLKTTTDFVNFTDRTSALDIGPYLIYSLKRGGSIWAIGAEIGKLKTTTNFENFTDRTSDLNFTSTVGAIGTDGTTWAFGGSAGKFKTTTDFVTFSDLTATISMGGVAIQSIEFNGTTWAIGGENGKLKTTANLANYTDRTSSLNIGSPTPVSAIATDGTTWAFGGQNKLKTSINFTNYTDRTSAVNLGSSTSLYAIEVGGTTWAIGATDGILKTTTNFVNFTQQIRTSFGGTMYSAETNGTTWAVGGNGGELHITTDLATFSDRTSALNVGGATRVTSIKQNSGTWAFGGWVTGSNLSQLRTTTDFTNFTDRTSNLNFPGIPNYVDSIAASAVTNTGTKTSGADTGSFAGGSQGRDGANGLYATTTSGGITHDYKTFSFGLSSETVRGIEVALTGSFTGGNPTTSVGPTNPTAHDTTLSNWAATGSAYTSNGSYATVTPGDVAYFKTFGFSIPSDSEITGIVVSAEGNKLSGGADIGLSGDLSSTGCSGAFTTVAYQTTAWTNPVGPPDVTKSLPSSGSTTDLWGRSASGWAPSDFNNGNLCVKLTGVKINTGSGPTGQIDAVSVAVYYQQKNARFQAQLFHNSSAGLSAARTSSLLSKGNSTSVLGGATDLWDRNWSATNDLGSAFYVRLTSVLDSGTAPTWQLDNITVTVYYDGSTPIWSVGGSGLKTTTNFVNFTDRSSNINMNGGLVLSSDTDGSVWAFGLDGYASSPLVSLKTTTDFVNFTNRTSAAGLSQIFSMRQGTARTQSASTLPTASGTGTFSTPNNAWDGIDNTYATTTTAGATQEYTTFSSFGLPQLQTIRGISVQLEASYSGGVSPVPQFKVELWHNSTGAWSAQSRNTSTLATTDANYTVGSAGEMWGETSWDATADLGSAFKVRVTSVLNSGSAPTWRLDTISVTVHYDGSTAVWALGADVGGLKTTTDFVNFTDRTSAADLSNFDVTEISFSQGVWAIGTEGSPGISGQFKTTVDFETFQDRTSDLSFGLGTSIMALTSVSETFLIGGNLHQLTTNGSNPLAVTLASFDARGYDAEVWVNWQTGSEIDNVGFNLYRAAEGEGSWTLLTPRPIQGLNTTDIGGKYLYRDTDVENDQTYFYYLEDIDLFTGGTLHGPVSARPMASLGPPRELSSAEQSTYAAIVFPTTRLSAPLSSRPSSPPTDGLLHASVVSLSGNQATIELWIPEGTYVDSRFSISGFGQLELPNRPIVPYRGVILGIPCREIASSSIQTLEEETYSPISLAIGEAAELQDAEGNIVSTSDVPSLWSQPGGSSGPYPSQYLHVGAPRCVGESGHVTFNLTPIRYTSPTLVQARHLRVYLTLGASLKSDLSGSLSPVQDSLAQDSFSVKLSIAKSGIYSVPASELSSVGWNPMWIRREEIRLYRAGVLVPIHWIGAESGPIGEDGILEFYGSYDERRHAPESVYWLSIRPQDVPPTGHVDGSPKVSDAEAALWTRSHAEVNRLYAPAFRGTPSSDRFFWQAIYWIPATATRPVTAIHPSVAVSLSSISSSGSDALLRYTVQTASDDLQKSPDHHLRAYVNDTLLDEFTADGFQSITRELSVPPSSLLEGTNTFYVEEVGDVSPLLARTYLNWVEVDYERLPSWDGSGEVNVWVNETGTAYLWGLPPSSSIALWDSADPAQRLSNFSVDENGNLSFRALLGHRYTLSLAPASVSHLWNNLRSRLREFSPTETLYIAYKDFLPAANRLAAYRRNQGRSVTVVDVEDVYDEYGDGSPSDDAITAFVQDWKQRFGNDFSLLLWGDASFDPHNYLNQGFADYVPTHLEFLQYSETASDPLLAYGSEEIDGRIRVGRVPARTLLDAQTLVDKILSYESTSPDQEWLKKITFVSDQPTQAWEQVFETFSRDLAQSLPAPFEGRVELSGPEVKEHIEAYLNEGTLFMNFFGHGAYAFWGRNQALTIDDLPALTNANQLTTITALNCLNGYFIDPRATALSEAMLLKPEGGAVAYLSSSGLNEVGPLKLFGENFYRIATNENPASLGWAMAKDAEQLVGVDHTPQLLSTMHLFGDPDLRLPGISPAISSNPSTVDLSTTGEGPTSAALGTSPTSAEEATPTVGCKSTQATPVDLLFAFTAALLLRRRKRLAFLQRARPKGKERISAFQESDKCTECG
ncbi:MAG TPA: C25 family cysteine peptidase [Bdellovibrionota bacterium]|nr:C25 family cysteine peptidase [Bdellovibrionota bacterium]